MNALEERISHWVDAGIISPEVGEDLRRYEAEHEPGDAIAAPAAPQPRAVALVGEVTGYLGAALVISAVSFLLRRTWTDLPDAGRIGIVAALLAVVAAAGAIAARVRADPAQRLASILLAGTVGMTAWLAWVVADVAGTRDEVTGVIVGACAVVVATAIYTLRRRALAQLVTLAALCGFTGAVIAAALTDRDRDIGIAVGLALAAIGIAWIVAGAVGRLRPPAPALVAGGFVAVFALQSTAYDAQRGWMLGVSVGVAIALIGTAIAVRSLAPLIVPGGVGLLVTTPQFIDHMVGDAVATWVGVLLTGVALVVAAVWMVRGRAHGRTGTVNAPRHA